MQLAVAIIKDKSDREIIRKYLRRGCACVQIELIKTAEKALIGRLKEMPDIRVRLVHCQLMPMVPLADDHHHSPVINIIGFCF